MPFTISCPKCGKTAGIPDDAAGKVATCPSCRQRFRVGTPPPAAIPVVAAVNPTTRTKSKRMMVVAAGAVAFVGLSLTALAVIVHESGSAKTESGAADAPSDTINVSSGKIWEEYGVNALQADQKYKGKTVWWKGSIGQGELRPDGDGYVLGQGIPDSAPGMPGPGRWTSRGPPPATKPATPPGGWTPTCICKIAPDAVAAFSKVTIGAEVTIVARCQGMRKDASAWQGYSVLFDQCRLK